MQKSTILTASSSVTTRDSLSELGSPLTAPSVLPFWYRGTRDGVFIGWRGERKEQREDNCSVLSIGERLSEEFWL